MYVPSHAQMRMKTVCFQAQDDMKSKLYLLTSTLWSTIPSVCGIGSTYCCAIITLSDTSLPVPLSFPWKCWPMSVWWYLSQSVEWHVWQWAGPLGSVGVGHFHLSLCQRRECAAMCSKRCDGVVCAEGVSTELSIALWNADCSWPCCTCAVVLYCLSPWKPWSDVSQCRGSASWYTHRHH